MIHISNLKKTYRPKGQPEVEALKGINLTLQDKGMLFILGKSGSGKSTLLNVLGGLDDYDGGEVKINGTSLDKLKGKNFDSYRSNYIGFIFQEYNLLSDFTIGENISLAIELQGKQVSSNRIEEVLKDVDLEGFYCRRITQISGGQMQRVAIARALIKDPKVILADEPTGNLDSETSDNIFKLLKKLSHDKLVIVVTHDREYAEKYANRIIELSDGEVISDNYPIERCKLKADNFIHFNSQRLPLKSIARIAMNNLKVKVVRLIVIILLFAFALSIFSVGTICSQMDFYDIALKTYQEQDYNMLTIIPTQNYDKANLITFNDMSLLQSKLDNFVLEPFYSISDEVPAEFNIYNSGVNNLIGINQTSGYMDINNGKLNNYNMQLVSGRLPNNGSEVAISLFRYKMIELYGYTKNSHISIINSYDESIGLTITPNNKYPEDVLTIVGIIDTNFDCDSFLQLLFNYLEYDNHKDASKKIRIIMEELPKSIHNIVFVNNAFVENRILGVSRNRMYTYFEHEYILRNMYGGEYSKINTYIPYGQSLDIAFINNINIIYINELKDIRQGEIVLHYNHIDSLIRSKNNGFISPPSIDAINNIIKDGLYIDICIDNKQLTSSNDDKTKTFKVIGYWKDKIEYINEESAEVDLVNSIFYSDHPYVFMSYYDLLNLSEEKEVISGFYVQMHKDDSINKELIKTIREYDNKLIILTSNRHQLDGLYNNSRFISMAGIIIGVAFGVISLLLILQYINMLLNYKSRNIGFLRSLGARKSDISAIYVIEGFMIAIIASLISSIASLQIIQYLNNFFNYVISIDIFNYTTHNLLMIILLSFAITIIAVLIPIYFIMKKKPAEIIYKSY